MDKNNNMALKHIYNQAPFWSQSMQDLAMVSKNPPSAPSSELLIVSKYPPDKTSESDVGEFMKEILENKQSSELISCIVKHVQSEFNQDKNNNNPLDQICDIVDIVTLKLADNNEFAKFFDGK